MKDQVPLTYDNPAEVGGEREKEVTSCLCHFPAWSLARTQVADKTTGQPCWLLELWAAGSEYKYVPCWKEPYTCKAAQGTLRDSQPGWNTQAQLFGIEEADSSPYQQAAWVAAPGLGGITFCSQNVQRRFESKDRQKKPKTKNKPKQKKNPTKHAQKTNKKNKTSSWPYSPSPAEKPVLLSKI